MKTFSNRLNIIYRPIVIYLLLNIQIIAHEIIINAAYPADNKILAGYFATISPLFVDLVYILFINVKYSKQHAREYLFRLSA